MSKSILMVEERRMRECVNDTARQIADYYVKKTGDHGIVMVPVMDGAIIFAADLLRALWLVTMGELPVTVFPVTCKSYGSGQQSEELVIHTQLTVSAFAGQDVLLVDDVLDTGNTLKVLKDRILALGAESVEIAVALRKHKPGQAVEATWRCADIPNVFVYGYGLDLAGQHRGCPEVRQQLPRSG